MKPKFLCEIADIIQTSIEDHVLIHGVSVDSRLTKPGDLFFALPGAKVDGHSFLAQAASNGAVGAVVHSQYRGDNYGLPMLRSGDVLASLQNFAKVCLENFKGITVAVTGSVGKTTTKDFISTLLDGKYRVSASPGNSNSQIGLPLTILNRFSLDEDVLIVEMGMTERGHISKLINIAPPTVALVTAIALVHACNFATIDEIASSKAEIFCHPKTKRGIYHKESDIGEILSRTGECFKQSFSMGDAAADFYLKRVEEKICIKDNRGEGAQEFPTVSLPGKHNLHNLLAAISVARYLGMEWEEIRQRQQFLILPERRMQFVEKFGALFINDAYNASEISVKAALDSLPQVQPWSKRIAVLGEMVELGKFSEQCHHAVGLYALDCIDSMLCFGTGSVPIYECWKEAGKPVVWAQERKGIVESLREQLKPGDVVLLKGSCVKEVWKILDEL